MDDTIHCVFYSYAETKGLERLNATVRWTVAADGSTEANLYLRKAQMQTSPFRCTPGKAGPCSDLTADVSGVQKLRTVEQFLARGRVHAALTAAGTAVGYAAFGL